MDNYINNELGLILNPHLKRFVERFNRTFELPFYKFIDIGGFNIVKFDKTLGVPVDISLKDFVQNKFGQHAVDLILEILNSKK